MISEKVENKLKEKASSYKILEFDTPFETTQQAADMMKIPVSRIAKVLVFRGDMEVIVVIVSGIAKIDNKKFKERFQIRPIMLSLDELKNITGYSSGSVSPIGISNGFVKVYMDLTIKKPRTRGRGLHRLF